MENSGPKGVVSNDKVDSPLDLICINEKKTSQIKNKLINLII